MTIRIGFSPCPNDTFIFNALINQRIDTHPFIFEPVIADVEELNRLAFAGELEVTKLSYHAFAYVADKYKLLNSGSALGNNCGPLLISKKVIKDLPSKINDLKIAIPGKYTTANFLLSIAFPQAQNKNEMIFSDIEKAVLNEEVDAGLIIHENRFTYEQKGLKKLIDLGEYWETKTGLPIPLGGIAVRKDIPASQQAAIDALLRKSVDYAFGNSAETMTYVRKYAQEMDEKVMLQHINLYVNDFTIDLGEKGRKAIDTLYKTAMEEKITPTLPPDYLVNKQIDLNLH